MKVCELIDLLSEYQPNAEVEFEIPKVVPKIKIKNEQIIVKRNHKVDYDKLVALYNAGWQYSDIAQELKVSEGTIRNYVWKHGKTKR